MGRERVLQKIKSQARGAIIAGSIFFIISAFLLFISFIVDEGIEVFLICFGFLFLCALAFLIFGIKNFAHPEKSSEIKANPRLLEQADELFSYIKYQDDFIILSDRIIANKKDIIRMAYLDEVYLIYISKSSHNFIPTSKLLIFATATGQFGISVYGRQERTIEQLINRIHPLCPNTRVGYTGGNLEYLEYMRNMYLQANKDAVITYNRFN